MWPGMGWAKIYGRGKGNSINLCLICVTNIEKLLLVSLRCISSCSVVFRQRFATFRCLLVLGVYTDPF